MKFKTRRPKAKEIALRRWHKWFAWYPVRIPETGKYIYWLEYVERKKYWIYSYSVSYRGRYERKYRLQEK